MEKVLMVSLPSDDNRSISLVCSYPVGLISLDLETTDLPVLRKLVAKLEELEKQEQDRKWIEETRALIADK